MVKPSATRKSVPVLILPPPSVFHFLAGGKARWTSLEHNGVLFPPDYKPHGVQILYDGEPVQLTPEQEEAATFFATMLDTDYLNKPTFIKNFWEDFKAILGRGHVIKTFEKIDFSPIHKWHLTEKERIKNLPKEVSLGGF